MTQATDIRVTPKPALRLGGALLLLLLALLVIVGGPLLRPELRQQALTTALPAAGPPLTVGATVYDFDLATVDGGRLQLSQQLATPLILNFWASWCGPCRLEAPHLQATSERYGDALQLIGVNQDEPLAAAQGFIDEFGWRFTSVLDEDAAVARLYGVFGTLPVTLFVDRDGTVVQIHRGPIAQSQLQQAIDKMLP